MDPLAHAQATDFGARIASLNPTRDLKPNRSLTAEPYPRPHRANNSPSLGKTAERPGIF
jgi:hypothetical protein